MGRVEIGGGGAFFPLGVCGAGRGSKRRAGASGCRGAWRRNGGRAGQSFLCLAAGGGALAPCQRAVAAGRRPSGGGARVVRIQIWPGLAATAVGWSGLRAARPTTVSSPLLARVGEAWWCGLGAAAACIWRWLLLLLGAGGFDWLGLRSAGTSVRFEGGNSIVVGGGGGDACWLDLALGVGRRRVAPVVHAQRLRRLELAGQCG